jgi:hypothetical protein
MLAADIFRLYPYSVALRISLSTCRALFACAPAILWPLLAHHLPKSTRLAWIWRAATFTRAAFHAFGSFASHSGPFRPPAVDLCPKWVCEWPTHFKRNGCFGREWGPRR